MWITHTHTHAPGSLFLQHLSRFGSLVDDLLVVGVFYLALIRRHLRPQRLLGLLAAVEPAGAALCSEQSGHLSLAQRGKAAQDLKLQTLFLFSSMQLCPTWSVKEGNDCSCSLLHIWCMSVYVFTEIMQLALFQPTPEMFTGSWVFECLALSCCYLNGEKLWEVCCPFLTAGPALQKDTQTNTWAPSPAKHMCRC